MAILSKQLVNVSHALKTHPFLHSIENWGVVSTFASIYSHVVFYAFLISFIRQIRAASPHLPFTLISF